ncbi:MAG: NUDIX hydrolase [Candidatus Pacebacteria bacterium]|nr:NUDIX hydrolase [Candidatus Paceibacterota bacterium]
MLTKKGTTMRFCVDAICKHYVKTECTQKYVVVKRLSDPKGLALPGGGIEKNERREDAIAREVEEETGLSFRVKLWLPKTYDEKGRDPRGDTTSYVAVGEGFGNIKNEKNKTEVILLTYEELNRFSNLFVFDHEKIIKDYMNH